VLNHNNVYPVPYSLNFLTSDFFFFCLSPFVFLLLSLSYLSIPSGYNALRCNLTFLFAPSCLWVS